MPMSSNKQVKEPIHLPVEVLTEVCAFLSYNDSAKLLPTSPLFSSILRRQMDRQKQLLQKDFDCIAHWFLRFEARANLLERRLDLINQEIHRRSYIYDRQLNQIRHFPGYWQSAHLQQLAMDVLAQRHRALDPLFLQFHNFQHRKMESIHQLKALVAEMKKLHATADGTLNTRGILKKKRSASV